MTAKIVTARRRIDRLAFVVWLDITKRVTPTVSTGTPLTAATATSGTVTGTPLTAGAWVGWIIQTASVWGLITANTTSVVTVTGWFKTSDGTSGTTPIASTAFTVAAPDERYMLRRDYPLGYESGRTAAALVNINAELVTAAQDQLARVADENSGGVVLSIEGQTF
jgi:hypothetical protein